MYFFSLFTENKDVVGGRFDIYLDVCIFVRVIGNCMCYKRLVGEL